jgi:endonuclease YncB( thermonuclease family)
MAGWRPRSEHRSAAGASLWQLVLVAGLVGFGLVTAFGRTGSPIAGAWHGIVQVTTPPPAVPERGGTIVGRASVIDGDTIEIRGTRIRLSGIDAPESRQSCSDGGGASYPCGRRAAFALADKIGASNLACEVEDHDRYGRSVATCRLGDLDVNGWLVSSGWALAYRQYSTAYVGAEAAARAAKAGIWQGDFTPPWDWRADERPAKSTTVPVASSTKRASCTIKGNVSAKGERIYHMPGQEHYARTVISPAKGERWFCSESEARSAGWRPAMR